MPFFSRAMRSVEPLNQERAMQRVEKFTSIKDCVERLAILNSMRFKPNQRGVGSRDREVAALSKKLKEFQNPNFL